MLNKQLVLRTHQELDPDEVCSCGLSGMDLYTRDENDAARLHYPLTRALHPEWDTNIYRYIHGKHYAFQGHRNTEGKIIVGPNAPRWMQAEMAYRARALQNESSYSGLQWINGERKGYNMDDPDVVGILFIDEAHYCILGACSFAFRTDGKEGYWQLHWIWLAPPARNKGILSRHWKYLVDRFGSFNVQAPYSTAIVKFLLKEEGRRQHLTPYVDKTWEEVLAQVATEPDSFASRAAICSKLDNSPFNPKPR